MPRLFIGVALPEEVRSYLASFRNLFPETEGNCSWVKPEKVHVTLKFLGEVEEKMIVSIIDRLGRICLDPFHLVLNQFGFFPNEKNPRVFWVDFIDGEPLKKLSDQINEELIEFRDDHPFKDHVTLARIKIFSALEKDRFIKKLNSVVLERKKFLVQEFALYRSDLLPQGSKYQVLKRFKLEK